MTTHRLKVEGMSCGHCVRAVQEALEAVPGVREVAVEIGAARVEADDGVTVDALIAALAEEEYRAVVAA